MQMAMSFSVVLSGVLGGRLAAQDIRHPYRLSVALGALALALIGAGFRETLPPVGLKTFQGLLELGMNWHPTLFWIYFDTNKFVPRPSFRSAQTYQAPELFGSQTVWRPNTSALAMFPKK